MWTIWQLPEGWSGKRGLDYAKVIRKFAVMLVWVLASRWTHSRSVHPCQLLLLVSNQTKRNLVNFSRTSVSNKRSQEPDESQRYSNTLQMFDIKYTGNVTVGCCVFKMILRERYTFMFIGRWSFKLQALRRGGVVWTSVSTNKNITTWREELHHGGSGLHQWSVTSFYKTWGNGCARVSGGLARPCKGTLANLTK